jgi:hypothetical protein
MPVINQRRWLSLTCLGLKLRLSLGLSLRKAYKPVSACLDLLIKKRISTEVGGNNPVHFHGTHILHRKDYYRRIGDKLIHRHYTAHRFEQSTH